jgi:hypothetical protein
MVFLLGICGTQSLVHLVVYWSIATLVTALEALRIFGRNWKIGLGATYARLCEVLSSRSSSSELKNGYRPKLLAAKGK